MTVIVTIDGPAGTGKSSAARILARRLNFIYVDTGAIYRALAYLVDKYHKDVDDVDQVLALIPLISVVVDEKEHCTKIVIEKQIVEKELRSEKISRLSSIVSQHKKIREALLPVQRTLLNQMGEGAIFEGRDIGTVVFPKALVKIFVTANSETRARRRYEELKGRTDTTYEEVLHEIKERDERDAKRVNAPMQKASDAHVIDTSDITLEQVTNQAQKLIEEAKSQRK